jgi:hypothetical protein
MSRSMTIRRAIQKMNLEESRPVVKAAARAEYRSRPFEVAVRSVP